MGSPSQLQSLRCVLHFLIKGSKGAGGMVHLHMSGFQFLTGSSMACSASMNSEGATSQLAVGGKLAWLGNELGLPQEIREG